MVELTASTGSPRGYGGVVRLGLKVVELDDSTGSPRGYGGVVRLGPKGDGTPQ